MLQNVACTRFYSATNLLKVGKDLGRFHGILKHSWKINIWSSEPAQGRENYCMHTFSSVFSA